MSPVPSTPSDSALATSAEWLRHGQTLEARGEIPAALAAYDRAIATSQSDARAHGLAWMNRGNALQKCHLLNDTSRPRTGEAVEAYDRAIACFEVLPLNEPLFRNHLGAAWLNRGHAQLTANDSAAAILSFEHAVAELAPLPLEADPHFRLNLAGAHTNLAHATLESAPGRACSSARAALAVLAPVEHFDETFAAMSLRARRALIVGLGEQLRLGAEPASELFGEATDAADAALALARELTARGATQLRPLAARLFRLGAQLYRTHQPHFLGEFLLENLDPEKAAAFARDPEFQAAAAEALTLARATLNRPRLLHAGEAETEKMLRLSRELASVEERLVGG